MTAEAAFNASALAARLAPQGVAVDLGAGDLTVLRQEGLLVVAFDYGRQHGSIGRDEARQLVGALDLARGAGLAVVFLLETSGIRVTDGTGGIASLRRILDAALRARLAGVPMLAMVLKSAFGGASLLAALCDARVIHAGSLFAMSGPKLIEATVGAARFDAADKRAVARLMSGAARAAQSQGFTLCAPDLEAYHAAFAAWLAAPRAPVTALSPSIAGHREVTLIAPEAAGLAQIRALARDLLPQPRTLVIKLHCESHAGTPEDEADVLSEVLGALSLQLARMRAGGTEIELQIIGRSGGGILAALGGAATRVLQSPDVRLAVLPKAALLALGKPEPAEAGSLASALAVGAVDGPLT